MAIFRFKDKDDEKDERVAISKKAMRRIVNEKDKKYEKLQREEEEWIKIAEEEKVMINKLEKRLKKQKILTLIYGLVGIGVGAGVTWLIQ